MKIIGVMVNSENPKKLGEFYTKVFGTPGWHEDEWYGFDVDGGSIMVGPHSEISGQSKEPARVMISISDSDVPGTFAKFVEAGAKVVAEPYQPDADGNSGVWLSTVSDPDGNYLQISTPWEA
jgi:predicted enzyme related to lactoylglutathione lyase